MSDIKWVKITTDMFDNRKIKHLRRLPEGNSIVLIWVMLLTMAGRCNAGGMIFLTENIPYTPKMLADELGFEENTVQLALNALEQLNMVVTNGGFFAIAGWDEYQSTDRLAEIREYNRLAKQKSREKQKLLQDVNDKSMTSQRCQGTDIDIEEDIEEEKEVLPKGNTKKPQKRRHGAYKHVLLLESEFDALANDYGEDVRDACIKFLDEYIEEKGYKSKSHNLAIRRWVVQAVEERTKKSTLGRREMPSDSDYYTGWDDPPEKQDDLDYLKEYLAKLKED